ncbi:restriction endonuclease subunit S [Acinetobacter indicus]|nr:restriction endonuclease subunit S [Acinetobacter indicus]
MFEKYDAYKDSGVHWLGSIPKHWDVKSLKFICRLQSGETIRPEDFSNEGFPVYGGNGFRGFTKKYTNEGLHVLIGRQGALCGNVNYADGQFYASEHAIVVYPYKNVDTYWLGEIIRVADLNKYSQSAAQPGIAVNVIENIRFPFPELEEQKKIADFLKKNILLLDQAIAIKEQQIALLNERKQIVIQKAVTQGLDPNVPMKDSGVEWIGQIPEHWDIERLGTMLEPVSKKGNLDKSLLSITREKGVILRDVEDDSENHNFIPDDLSNYKLIEKGQFGMNKMKAWQGSYGVSPYTGIVSPAYYVFKFIKPIHPEFFHWAIRSKLYVSFLEVRLMVFVLVNGIYQKIG